MTSVTKVTLKNGNEIRMNFNLRFNFVFVNFNLRSNLDNLTIRALVSILFVKMNLTFQMQCDIYVFSSFVSTGPLISNDTEPLIAIFHEFFELFT